MLVATDELTHTSICEKLGISRRTLSCWKDTPGFASRVKEHLAKRCEAVRGRVIAQAEQRVQALDDRWNRMRQVIEERARDHSLAGVPGAATGLIVKQTKAAGSGETFRLIDEYVVDVALLRELREHEKQAAQELGQWIESRRIEQFTKTYVVLGPEDL